MSTLGSPTPHRTLRQIVDKDGKPCQAVFTENVWVGYNEPYQALNKPTQGNAVAAFTTGKGCFAEITRDMNNAKETIYIAGWQICWDTLLIPGKRLFDVLLAAAGRGVKIYVMPWDHSAAIQLYGRETKIVLEYINKLIGGETKVVYCELSEAFPDEAPLFFLFRDLYHCLPGAPKEHPQGS